MSWWDKLIGRANEASSNRRSGSNRRKPKPKQSKPKSSGGSKPKSNKPTRPTGTANHRGGTSAPVNRRRSDSSSQPNRNKRIQQREQKSRNVRDAYKQNQAKNKSGTAQHKFKATVKKWDTQTQRQDGAKRVVENNKGVQHIGHGYGYAGAVVKYTGERLTKTGSEIFSAANQYAGRGAGHGNKGKSGQLTSPTKNDRLNPTQQKQKADYYKQRQENKRKERERTYYDGTHYKGDGKVVKYGAASVADKVSDKMTKLEESTLNTATSHLSDNKDIKIPKAVDSIPLVNKYVQSTEKQQKQAKAAIDKNLSDSGLTVADVKKQTKKSRAEMDKWAEENGITEDTVLTNGMTYKEFRDSELKKWAKDYTKAVLKAREDAYKGVKDVGKISQRDVAKGGIKLSSEMLDYLVPYMGSAKSYIKAADAMIDAGKAAKAGKVLVKTTEKGTKALTKDGKDLVKAVMKDVNAGKITREEAVATLRKQIMSSNLKTSIKREALANAMQDISIGTPIDLIKGKEQGLEGKDLAKFMGTSAALNLGIGAGVSAIAGRTGKAGKAMISKDIKTQINDSFATLNKMDKSSGIEMSKLLAREKVGTITEAESKRLSELRTQTYENKGGIAQMTSDGKIVTKGVNGVVQDAIPATVRREFEGLEAKATSGVPLTRTEAARYNELSQRVAKTFEAVETNAYKAIQYGKSAVYAKHVDMDTIESAVNFAKRTGDQRTVKSAEDARINVAQAQFGADRKTAKFIATAEERSKGNVIIRPMDEELSQAIRNTYDEFRDPSKRLPNGFTHFDEASGRRIILINPKIRSKKKTAITLAHEITHGIIKADKTFLAAIKKLSGDAWGEEFAKVEKAYSKIQERGDLRVNLDEETACNLTGRYIESDKNIWAFIAGEDPKSFGKIRNHFKGLMKDSDFASEAELKAINKQIKKAYEDMQHPKLDDSISEAMMGESRLMLDDKYAPVFYSKMYDVVDKHLGKNKRFGTQDFVKFFKKKGVKAEEVKWSGIETFLEGKKSVTKEELLDFIQANALELKTKTRTTGFDADGNPPFFMDSNTPSAANSTNWERYALPGGENYREYEYILPTDRIDSDYTNDAMSTHWGDANVVVHSRIQDFSIAGKQKPLEAGKVTDEDIKSLANEIEEDFIGGYLESIDAVYVVNDTDRRMLQATEEEGGYIWMGLFREGTEDFEDESNLINATMVSNSSVETGLKELYDSVPSVRYEPGNGKVLFVEEIQSDWHNAGAKEGYFTEADAKRKDVLDQTLSSLHEKFKETDKKLYRLQGKKARAFSEEIFDIDNEYQALSDDVLAEWDDVLDGKMSAFKWNEKNKDKLARINELNDQKSNAAEAFEKNHPEYQEEINALQKDIDGIKAESDELQEESLSLITKLRYGAPDAPYKKNYVDYAMKRAFREAAENGQDYVAWTTADIQSARWSDKFAEGYGIEYDQEIPGFVNSYIKKWDPNAKVERITLAENGETVWAVKLPEQMKRDVLYKGQSSFSLSEESKSLIYKIIDRVKLTKDDVFEGGQVKKSAADAYMAAAKAGDEEVAQKFVDAVLAERGYTVDAYHGTKNFGFTKFNLEGGKYSPTVFASSEESVASSYSPTYGTRKISSRDDSPIKVARSSTDYKRLKDAVEDYEINFDVDAALENPPKEGLTRAFEDAITASGYKYEFNARTAVARFVNKENGDSLSLTDIDSLQRHVEGLESIMAGEQTGVYHGKLKLGRAYEYDATGMHWDTLDLSALGGSKYEGTTDDLANLVIKKGYDSLVIRNLNDIADYGTRGGETYSDLYVLFKEDQFKSADAITKDDDGNIIPLYERGLEGESDIRFSLDTEDEGMFGRLKSFDPRKPREGAAPAPASPVQFSKPSELFEETKPAASAAREEGPVDFSELNTFDPKAPRFGSEAEPPESPVAFGKPNEFDAAEARPAGDTPSPVEFSRTTTFDPKVRRNNRTGKRKGPVEFSETTARPFNPAERRRTGTGKRKGPAEFERSKAREFDATKPREDVTAEPPESPAKFTGQSSKERLEALEGLRDKRTKVAPAQENIDTSNWIKLPKGTEAPRKGATAEETLELARKGYITADELGDQGKKLAKWVIDNMEGTMRDEAIEGLKRGTIRAEEPLSGRYAGKQRRTETVDNAIAKRREELESGDLTIEDLYKRVMEREDYVVETVDSVADKNVLLEELAKRYYENGDENAGVMWHYAADKANIGGSLAGNALQLQRAMYRSSPQARVRRVEKEVAALNEEYKEILSKYKTEVKIDKEMLDRLYKAETDKEIMEATKAISDEIWKQIPSTRLEAANHLRHFMMLANPKTHGRNVSGNTVFLGARILADEVEHGMVRLMAKAGTKKMKEALKGQPVLEKATRAEKKECFDLLNERFDIEYGMSGRKGDRYLESKRTAGYFYERSGNKVKDTVAKGINKLIDKNYKALDTEDMWFFRPAFRREYIRWCKANGIGEKIDGELTVTKKALEEMTDAQQKKAMEYAIGRGKYATYRDDSAVSSFLVKLKQTTEQGGNTGVQKGLYKLANVGLESVLPFIKTPVNILRRGVDFSPVGLGRGLANAVYNARKANDPEIFMKAISDISTGMTGTGVAILGWHAANHDWVTVEAGEVSGDEWIDREYGYQNYSAKISVLGKDYSLSLDWVAPNQFAFFQGAAVYKEFGEDGTLSTEKFLKCLEASVVPLTEMSFMSTSKDTITNFIDRAYIYGDDKEKSTITAIARTLGGDLPQGWFGGFVPQLLNQTAGFMDDKVRDTSSTKEGALQSSWDRWLKQMQNRIPGLREQLNPKVGMHGEDVSNDGINTLIKFANSFANPATIKPITLTKYDQNLINDYHSLDDGTDAKKYFWKNFGGNPSYDINGKMLGDGEDDRRMTYDEKYRYAKAKRKAQWDNIKAMMDSPRYENMSAEMRGEEISGYNWISDINGNLTIGRDEKQIKEGKLNYRYAANLMTTGEESRFKKAKEQLKAIKTYGGGTRDFVDSQIEIRTLDTKSHSDWDWHTQAVALEGMKQKGKIGSKKLEVLQKGYDIHGEKTELAKTYLKGKKGKALTKALEDYATGYCGGVTVCNAEDVGVNKRNRSIGMATTSFGDKKNKKKKEVPSEAVYRAMGYTWNNAQAGGGLVKYGYSYKKLEKMEADAKLKFDTDYSGTLKKDEKIAYVDSLDLSKFDEKDRNDVRACIFEYLSSCDARTKNPYGTIFDHLHWGDNKEEENSSGGRGGRGRRGWGGGGWGHGGGGSGGSAAGVGAMLPAAPKAVKTTKNFDELPKANFSQAKASKAKVSDTYSRASDFTKPSTLNDAYRKRARKLSASMRNKLS